MEASIPNIWGPGQLMAFSGLDGDTDWSEPFVLHTGRENASLEVKLPGEALITLTDAPPMTFRTVLGDCFEAETSRGLLKVAFADHHTLVGQLPEGTGVAVDGKPLTHRVRKLVEARGVTLSGVVAEGKLALVVTGSRKKKKRTDHVKEALEVDVDQVVKDRSNFVLTTRTPSKLGVRAVRLYRKALSVMKVNYHGPCGIFKRRWTTPDRWPHEHMWLWDSAFHAVGMARIDPDAARDALLAVIEQIDKDGFLAHTLKPDGKHSKVTQPPILCWAVQSVVNATGELDWIEPHMKTLEAYLEWDRKHRDENENHLQEWVVEGDPLCRCGESGLDNSPRFDREAKLDAVDFSAWLAGDYHALADLAKRLKMKGMQKRCVSRGGKIARQINELLWCDKRKFYFDRTMDGELTGIHAVSGFMPLFSGSANHVQARSLLEKLFDKDTFGSALPTPSVALCEGSYSKDMWRGPTWLNLDYMIFEGLRRYRFQREARRYRQKVLAAVLRWYEVDGCIYEFYDSMDLTHPRELDRKRRLTTGKGMAPISDYHWSAAVTAALLLI